MKHITLSEGEWKIMKLLWKKSPYTLGELAKVLEGETGWTRATVFVMLKRLIAKGAVRMDDSGKLQEYYPLIKREDVIPQEVDSFLSRVFDGSVGMMISALTDRKSLTKTDIAELRHILDEAEQNGKE